MNPTSQYIEDYQLVTVILCDFSHRGFVRRLRNLATKTDHTLQENNGKHSPKHMIGVSRQEEEPYHSTVVPSAVEPLQPPSTPQSPHPPPHPHVTSPTSKQHKRINSVKTPVATNHKNAKTQHRSDKHNKDRFESTAVHQKKNLQIKTAKTTYRKQLLYDVDDRDPEVT